MPRFRQRLLKEDGSILADDAVISSPLDLQLVLLSFCPTTRADASHLTKAVEEKDLSAMESLLQLPQDPDIADERGKFAMGLAVAQVFDEGITLLWEAGADMRTIAANDFCDAVMSDRTDLVSWLLESGCEVDGKDSHGQTPLELASYFGQREMSQLLIDWGADPDKARKRSRTALHDASQSGQVLLVQELLEWRADVNLTTADGETALHRAAKRLDTEVLQTLLVWRAHVDVATVDGRTALQIATEEGNRDGVELLLEAKADKEKHGNHGNGKASTNKRKHKCKQNPPPPCEESRIHPPALYSLGRYRVAIG